MADEKEHLDLKMNKKNKHYSMDPEEEHRFRRYCVKLLDEYIAFLEHIIRYRIHADWPHMVNKCVELERFKEFIENKKLPSLI